MNIKDAISTEHSKQQRDKIAAYVGTDKKRFALLMKIFLEADYRIAQRASWPVGHIIENHPEMVTPYYGKLLALLKNKEVHPAVLRSITRLFQFTEIPKRYQGKLMDTCFKFLLSNCIPVAVKAFSITILEQLAIDYPEIIPEIKLAIEENKDRASPSIRARAKNILKKA